MRALGQLSMSASLCILTSSLILAGRSSQSVSYCFCRRCLSDVMFILPRPQPRRWIDNYLRKQSLKRRSWWQRPVATRSPLVLRSWLWHELSHQPTLANQQQQSLYQFDTLATRKDGVVRNTSIYLTSALLRKTVSLSLSSYKVALFIGQLTCQYCHDHHISTAFFTLLSCVFSLHAISTWFSTTLYVLKVLCLCN